MEKWTPLKALLICFRRKTHDDDEFTMRLTESHHLMWDVLIRCLWHTCRMCVRKEARMMCDECVRWTVGRCDSKTPRARSKY